METIRKMAWVDHPEHLEIRESPLPEPAADEVLIRTACSAICGSDLHLYRGKHPFVKLPSTIGHELSGYVAATGSAVTAVKVGDLAVPEPVLVCGRCDNCLHGNYHMCRSISYGYRKGEAGFGSYYLCKERWVHRLEPSIDFREAALIEPLSVAIHGVEKAGNLLGKTVAVLGAGAIGAFSAVICKLKGATSIYLIDANDARLKIAGEGVATRTVSARQEDPVAVILRETGGKGCDVVLECTGVGACILQTVELASQMGVIVQIGIPTHPLDAFPYARILQKELTVKGSQGYCFDFEKAICLLNAGRIDLSRYITGEYPFERINDAFAAVAAPNTPHMKVVVTYGK